MVLFFKEAEILIFDFGVADIQFFATDQGFGIPPPTILTDVVFTPEALGFTMP